MAKRIGETLSSSSTAPSSQHANLVTPREGSVKTLVRRYCASGRTAGPSDGEGCSILTECRRQRTGAPASRTHLHFKI